MKKKYRVKLTLPAEQDVARIHDYIARDKPRTAMRWAKRVFQLAHTLESQPFRYEEIPETEGFSFPYRHVLFGNYRLIYRIVEEQVTVVRVIHAARELHPEFLEGDPSS